jgi:hypothetical protein
MMKRLVSLLVLVGLAACESGTSSAASKKPIQTVLPADVAASVTLSDVDVANQVQAYLGSIDTPISAERWQSLGPRGFTALQAIASDAAVLPTRRARAIDGLVQMNATSAATVVLRLANDEAENASVRSAAVRAVGSFMPDAAGDAALSNLVRTANELRVRAVAAELLSRRAGGCEVVKAQVATERDEARGVFSKATSRCDAPTP